MAESSLTLAWAELKQAVGKFINYGSTIANWTAAQVTEIEAIVQSGIRRVYYPLGAQGAHEWSFLRPSTTLDLVVAQYIYNNNDADIGDSFGRLIGEMHYDAGENRRPVVVVPIATILDYRSHFDQSGDPEFVAERFKTSDGSGGQRHELLFYPTPDAVKTLNYTFEAYSGQLSDANPYPLGGMQMSELYKESCLSVAESEVMEELGLHTQQYQALLADAITRDKRRAGKVYGQMGNRELGVFPFRRGYTGSAYDITYDGITY